ncbi:MAG: hypothetical protein VR72_08315 [Clostridiaceae bacterium BRH_c20a]|nr:MAG: hypothetical protein VR72_08315 [Clostridiaceae bacterium BRH_c20a]
MVDDLFIGGIKMDEILFIIVFGSILLFALMLIGLPLIKEGRSPGIYINRDEQSNSEYTILATINEIEFDYQMGKLSKDDYLYLKNQYKSMAVKLLQEKDKQESSKADDLIKAIEKEIDSELEIADNSPVDGVGR